MTYLESLSNCLSINTSFMNIGSLVPEIIGFKCWQPRPFLQKFSKFGGAISPQTTGPIGPQIFGFGAVGSQITCIYQISLKSESVGFKLSVILGDLTRNDPVLLFGTVTGGRPPCPYSLYIFLGTQE